MIGKIYTLGDVATYINGRAFKPAEWETTGLPIVRIQNLTDRTAPCNRSTKKFEDKYLLKDGDLLFAWAASLGVHIWQGGPAWLNQHIFKVIPNEGIEKRYLYFYLLYTISDLYRKAHGSGMVHITKGPFLATKIPLPSVSEQRCLVAKIEELFSELDNSVAALKQTKAQLSVYRQAVLNKAFEDISDGYKGTLLDVLVAKPKNGYSPKAVSHQTPYKNLTLSATTEGFFKNGYFKYIELPPEKAASLWVKNNDILIQRANTIDYVGTSVLYRGEDNLYVYPDLMMKCRVKENVNPAYIVYQLQSPRCRQYFKNNATGTSGNMPKINQQTVSSTPLILTNLKKQETIVRDIEMQFSTIDIAVTTINKTLRQAESLRQSILKQAFEGKLV